MTHRENSGDDWQFGDWAECVEDDWWIASPADGPASSIRIGDKLMVSAVHSGPHPVNGEPIIALSFIGKPRTMAWLATGFRKIISDKEDRLVERRAKEPVA